MADIFISYIGGDDGIAAAIGERIRHDRPSWSLFCGEDNIRDGRLASGFEDGKIKIWPREGTGGEPLVLSHGSQVLSLAVLQDGRLASGGTDGTIKLWLVDEHRLIAALCLRAGRNLGKDEWARYIGADIPWQPSCRDRRSNWRTPDP